MSRPQLFGTVIGGEFGRDGEPGRVRIRLDDGHETAVVASDGQVQGYKLGGRVRMALIPTTPDQIAKIKGGAE